MKKNRVIKLVFILSLFLLLTACGEEKDIIENVDSANIIQVEDDFGNNIQLNEYPKRIISLSPSTTEILFALGLNDEIVGVSDYCDYPEIATEKDKIGGFDKPNLEKIVSLSPDLVIKSGNEDKEGAQILYGANIQVATFNSKDIDSIFTEINRIGIITGKVSEAEQLISDMKQKKEVIIEKSKMNDGKKVFYEVWHDPLMGAGKGSFMDELINLAGGKNITGDIENPYPEVSMESIIEKNPQVYLTTDGGIGKTKEDIKLRTGFANIDAIKNDKIYFLDNNIVSRPGPRIVEALEIVYETINQ